MTKDDRVEQVAIAPCRKCGSTAELRHSNDGEVSWVQCSGCDARGSHEYSDDLAVFHWNAGKLRAPLSRPVQSAELLEAAKAIWPKNLLHVPEALADDFIFPMDVTAGELRALRTAITKAQEQGL